MHVPTRQPKQPTLQSRHNAHQHPGDCQQCIVKRPMPENPRHDLQRQHREEREQLDRQYQRGVHARLCIMRIRIRINLSLANGGAKGKRAAEDAHVRHEQQGKFADHGAADGDVDKQDEGGGGAIVGVRAVDGGGGAGGDEDYGEEVEEEGGDAEGGEAGGAVGGEVGEVGERCVEELGHCGVLGVG